MAEDPKKSGDYFDPFSKDGNGDTQGGGVNNGSTPTGNSSGDGASSGGYGSFGRPDGTSGQNPQGSSAPYGNAGNGENGGNGFYGPDYFSGAHTGGSGFGYGPGGPTYTPTQPAAPKKSGGNGLAIASMVCGIVAFVICCVDYIMLALGIIAIVLAFVSRSQNGKFSGMAIAGLVLGIIAVVFSLISIICDALYGSQITAYFEDLMNQMQEETQNGGGSSSGGSGDGGQRL